MCGVIFSAARYLFLMEKGNSDRRLTFRVDFKALINNYADFEGSSQAIFADNSGSSCRKSNENIKIYREVGWQFVDVDLTVLAVPLAVLFIFAKFALLFRAEIDRPGKLFLA